MKKVLTVFMAAALMLCLFSGTALAESSTENSLSAESAVQLAIVMNEAADVQASQTILDNAQYAYMPLEGAAPEMQDKILQAREEIIYSVSWFNDEFEGQFSAYTDDGLSPANFSDLFPDWDVPEISTAAAPFVDSNVNLAANGISCVH